MNYIYEDKLDQILNLLEGVDKDGTEHNDGWWPNSVGARFGSDLLAKIKQVFSIPNASIDSKEQLLERVNDVTDYFEKQADTYVDALVESFCSQHTFISEGDVIQGAYYGTNMIVSEVIYDYDFERRCINNSYRGRIAKSDGTVDRRYSNTTYFMRHPNVTHVNGKPLDHSILHKNPDRPALYLEK